METFKTLLFGISGVSLIFWVSVIAIWHVEMFPRFFKEDWTKNMAGPQGQISYSKASSGGLIEPGSLRPQLKESSLLNRSKYSRKSIVVADFSPIEEGYGVNRLFISILLSLGVMSFILLTYGLHSGLTSLIPST